MENFDLKQLENFDLKQLLHQVYQSRQLNDEQQGVYDVITSTSRPVQVLKRQKQLFNKLKQFQSKGYQVNVSKTKPGRLFLVQKQIKKAVIIKKDIQMALNRVGYEVTDYIKGLCVKKDNRKNEMKIGKVLTKIGTAAQKKNKTHIRTQAEYLKRQFEKDPVRKGTKSITGNSTGGKKLPIILITKRKQDIALMSTTHSWQQKSCMRLTYSNGKQYVKKDVKYGTIMACQLSAQNLQKIKIDGRTLIWPYANEKDESQVIYYPSKTPWGRTSNNFLPFLQWLFRDIQGFDDTFNVYKFNPQLYDYGQTVKIGLGLTGVNKEAVGGIINKIKSSGQPVTEREEVIHVVKAINNLKGLQLKHAVADVNDLIIDVGGQVMLDTSNVKKITFVKGLCPGGVLPIKMKQNTQTERLYVVCSSCDLKTLHGLPKFLSTLECYDNLLSQRNIIDQDLKMHALVASDNNFRDLDDNLMQCFYQDKPSMINLSDNRIQQVNISSVPSSSTIILNNNIISQVNVNPTNDIHLKLDVSGNMLGQIDGLLNSRITYDALNISKNNINSLPQNKGNDYCQISPVGFKWSQNPIIIKSKDEHGNEIKNTKVRLDMSNVKEFLAN